MNHAPYHHAIERAYARLIVEISDYVTALGTEAETIAEEYPTSSAPTALKRQAAAAIEQIAAIARAVDEVTES